MVDALHLALRLLVRRTWSSGMSFPSTWTVERIDAMKTLLGAPERWSAEAVSSIISKQFGLRISRNSVIGKAARLGIPLNNNISGRKPKSEPKPKRKPKATPAQRRGLGVAPTMSKTQQPQAPAKIRCDPLKAGTFHVIELEEGMCRYPSGDSEITFCGLNQVEAMPYCGPHCQIAFQPARPGTRPQFQHRRRA
jgi:GcrA cell cycle regulator